MPQLFWGNVLNFNSMKEYYETLGFLCKEDEVIRVYYEHNEKAGARGPQGRMLLRKGNYDFFPRPLKEAFKTSKDGRISETKYVRNLRNNHFFNKEVDPTGSDFTKWLYKVSLEDVKSTIPAEHMKDFERGYNWNYKIDTRVINKEILEKNASEKNITEVSNSKNRVLSKNEKIALDKVVEKKAEKYDIFMSHSSLDEKLVLSLIDLFNEAGYSVYVDWIEDINLHRANVTPKTAEVLRDRMKRSCGLAYIATSNAVLSKWCPWELGFFDGKKNGKCCILPVMEQGEFNGQEYMGLYPYLRYDRMGEEETKEFWIYDQETNKYVALRSWLERADPFKY